MTIIDLFREFSKKSLCYPKSAKILYYTMLSYWNENGRPEVTSLPTKLLYTLACLPETTFREAVQYLSSRGWFKRVKSRERGDFAWIWRDKREETAQPALFVIRAREQNETRREESPIGDSSSPTLKESKNDIARTSPNVGTSSAVGGISEAVRTDSERAKVDMRKFPDYF